VDSSNNKRKMSVSEENKEDRSETVDDSNGSDAKKAKTGESGDQQSSQTTRPRHKTMLPDLLLSFIYFDTNRNNYIHYKDLEDIVQLAGLNLTRSKLKCLSDKLTFKDSLLNYRYLTDLSSSTGKLGYEDSFFQLETDDTIVDNILTFDLYMKRLLEKGNKQSTENAAVAEQHFVEINGTTIDVLNTIKKLEKSETNLNCLDEKLKETLNELERQKIVNRSLDRQKQKSNDELTDYKVDWNFYEKFLFLLCL
jgi:hypothetical protein